MAGHNREAGGDMKVLPMLAFAMLAAAGVALVGADVLVGITSRMGHATASTEPATMLMSGAALLALGGAVRRLAVSRQGASARR